MPFKVSYHSASHCKYLTPGEFLTLLKTDRGCIKTSKFIAPKPGSFGMGKVYVEYKYAPKAETANSQVK